jgi:hypothetical protein
MRVLFERSGGFAGIPLTLTIDLANLSPDEATQLNRLIEQADFFNLPTTISSAAKPDRFQYRVTIEGGDRHHTVSVGETAAPDTLKPLLNWLVEFARKQK